MPADPKRVKEVFLEAAELPDGAARSAFLDRSCGGDADLRGRVEVLLRSHDPEGSFLGTPAAVVPDPDAAATRAFEPDPDHAATRTGGGSAPTDDEVPLGFLVPTQRPDSLGRLGHYEVLQVLGKGGFGIVFRAFDDVLQRVVAVKVMAPQIAATSPARKRFLREARSSAAVRHENVVQVYKVVEQPLPYLVMEFIPGETLQDKLNRTGPLEVADIVRIGRQIAEGLAAAHATDLIHRDIKPGNVLIESGARKTVKITDFGLARAADDASISQSGLIAGTPMYMAPEQATGETLDQRADLFSLGSVLYQMASGRPPFRANSTVAVLKRVAEETPRSIREIIPETPQWLCDIITKLHAKNPDERFQSAREVADVFADCEAQLKANSKLKDFSRIPLSKQPTTRKSGSWKWAAAAVLLLPVLALAVSEFAGVTQLFRPQATTDPITPVAQSEVKTPPTAIAPAAIAPTTIAPFTDADVQRIAALAAAEQVEEVRKELMRRNPGFDGKVEHKIEDGVVTELKMVTPKVTDISPIRVFNALRTLDLSARSVNKKAFSPLTDLSPLTGMNLARLTQLILTDTQVNDAGMVNFKDCKALTHLHLDGTDVSDRGLAHFKDCKNLANLKLSHTWVGDAGLAHFQDCKGLNRLYLSFTKVSDTGLAHFKDCKNLTHLHLNRTQVGDAGLAHFKGMPLNELAINSTGITDLTPLQGMPLEEICLTPKSITKGLALLRDMKSIKSIGIQYGIFWPAAEYWERYDKGEFTK
ncbi:serine/threonine-protein kinase [Urbifossiella limnaea]|uniref:non-specific serine/threonine protein kinase n=1 Tax=Urbifossiella limnaea TaxID=2528023 RepID=A0A517Y1H3_9BACT|nr:serine/threonine-protein kinase [Urbifossiella limnaea]QDU23600.1 Serine/threonine-protein kinase PrkC [Urbifossiella limnaea]